MLVRCSRARGRTPHLGHRVLFALDAAHTSGRVSQDGQAVGADQRARVTATNLHGEFATVVSTAQLLGSR